MINISGKSFWLFICLGLTGCSTISTPKTPGDRAMQAPSFGYSPFDPLSVTVRPGGATTADILKALPNETMRLAIGQTDGRAQLNYGPASVGYAGTNYQVVLDYIKFNTKPFGLVKTIINGKPTVFRLPNNGETPNLTVPVYVGVGVRLTAEFKVNKGNVNLSFSGIGAAGAASQISGTLVLQTLGISGSGVTLSVATEINPTTIQNALVAFGTVKSKIYSSDVTVAPEAVATFNNFGADADTFSTIYSWLVQQPLPMNVSPNAAAIF